jgi:glycosyltransferase involved in cell wall biosynthesis
VTELLIDATALADGSEYRGIGTYLRQLLAGLATADGLATKALIRPGSALPVGVVPAPVFRAAPGRFRAAEHELLLPFDLRRHPADVVHSPANTPPRRCAVPWVVTLHDVIPLAFDDPELARERRRFGRHSGRYREAAAVIAVSRHTADTGISALGLDPKRVEVIPHGVGYEFAPRSEPPSADPPYLLVVGEYSRRKGYDEAFAVIGGLGEQGFPHELHVTGRVAPWLERTVQAVVDRAPRPDRVRLLGFVDDLVAEYQGATALLMTSRYEGFGLPALEAMACGTPVVAFANSAVTEVVADAGVLVEDGDSEAMTRAVRALLNDPPRMADLSARGLERARSFSWERSVALHAELFRAVAR